MSLVPIRVHIGEGMVLEDPLILFPEGFICFDDDDPPEIVIWTDDQGAPVAQPSVVLARLGWPGVSLGTCIRGRRSAHPERSVPPCEMRPAIWWFFKRPLSSRMPREALALVHNPRPFHVSERRGECAYEGFQDAELEKYCGPGRNRP